MVGRLNIGIYGSRGIPSTYSGYETFLTTLLPELARRGHEVTIYCRRDAVPSADSFLGVRKRFVPALQTKELGTLTHGLLSAVVARLRRHDVVFVVNPANALFCAFGKLTGQPVVLNTDGQEWIRGKWGPMGKRYFKTSAAFAGAASTALVSDSVAMADIYLDQFGASSTVIPYCWTDLAPSGGMSKLAELGVVTGEFSALAGRLIPENNAVPVARAYLETHVTWPLVVMGTANYDSPVQRELSALAASDDRLRLAGHIGDRGQYAALVRSAGLYLHAHSVGGINPSLVEAMGLGAFVLALGTPFNREALGAAGHYFDDFGSGLRTQIERLTNAEPAAVAGCRDAARARCASEFGLQDVADAVEELLVAAAEGPARRRLAVDTRWSKAVRPRAGSAAA